MLVVLVAGCAKPASEPVRIFAAASTREALQQITADFQAETGQAVELSLGASSDLARQIEQGAPADLFLSADQAWADYLADRSLVVERRDRLTNRLVVIVPAASALHLSNLTELAGPEVQRLALAGAAVPAGRYARQALKRTDIWDSLKDRVLEGRDVRATLTYVSRGEAEAGIVYATDVGASPDVRVVLEIAADLHDPIRYPLVLLQRQSIQSATRRFYDYLNSDKTVKVLRRAGFGVLP
jgi:molybdate transport system substrate-binding protein